MPNVDRIKAMKSQNMGNCGLSDRIKNISLGCAHTPFGYLMVNKVIEV
jgi:hypothetical protein